MTRLSIILRKATRKDAAHMALLDDMASHGLSSWLWHGALERRGAETIFDWGRQRMLKEDDPASYTNGIIAETKDDVCGMAIGYFLPENLSDEAFDTDIDVLKPIMALFNRVKGHWLVDALACYPEFRKNGVGQSLLEDQINRAKLSPANAISLVAENTNRAAIGLYEKNGFRFQSAEKAVPFSKRNTANEYQLMTATL